MTDSEQSFFDKLKVYREQSPVYDKTGNESLLASESGFCGFKCDVCGEGGGCPGCGGQKQVMLLFGLGLCPCCCMAGSKQTVCCQGAGGCPCCGC